MHRPRLTYVLSVMTFLAVCSWMSVRAYDSIIGQIYYGPLKGFFAAALHMGSPKSFLGTPTKAAIFRPRSSPSRFGDPSGPVDAWTRVLARQRVEFQIIDEKTLDAGALEPFNVLILPFAPRLSDAEISAVKAFVSESGHGLILSGASGAFRENGDWRDISLAAEISGSEKLAEVAAYRGGLATIALDGRSPISANVPPGLRISFNRYDRPVSLRPLEPRAQTAAYWLEGDSFDPEDAGASIIDGSYRGGRFIWTGFTLESAVEPDAEKATDALARNMLAFATFKPIFAKENWPEGKRAAVVFDALADEPGALSADAATFFQKRRVPFTLFCPLETARSDAAALKALEADPSADVALRVSSADLRVSTRAQRAVFRGERRAFDTIGLGATRGVSAPDAFRDPAAMRALLEAGYSYIATDSLDGGPPVLAQSYRPYLLSFGRNVKYLMRVPNGFDEKVSAAAGAAGDGDADFDRLKREFDAAYRLGGFYRVSIPATLFRQSKRVAALGRFLDYLKTKNVWLANCAQAAQWTHQWQLVDIDSAKASDVRSNLIVTNSSPDPMDLLRIDMYLPQRVSSIEASSERMGGAIDVVSRQEEKATLELRDLRGEGMVFLIDATAADEN